MPKLWALLAVAGIALAAVSAAAMRRARPTLTYAHDVAPIFARACGECHAGARPRGGLRLDQPARVATVVARGNSADSQLVRRLLGQGGDERMPAGRDPLPAAEIAIIRGWIDQGAAGLPAPAPPVDRIGAHWAYRPPVRPPLPEIANTAWPRNDIDRFVLARLEKEMLAPAPEADPVTLLRRVTLDLTGLPPTPREIDAYLADLAGAAATPDAAYQRLVDRLLGSPHFGERWAVPWLDVARYADSNGYEKDAGRSIWKYRDWVVQALNDDMPFDRFTLEQIAGDLLPGAEVAQRIATGFHRNTMFNEEGGVDKDEARFERLCDRAATTATVWLGSTLGCARCHDHKHDPFPQRDFYGLLAYFEDGREEILPLPTAAQARRLADLRTERAQLEQVLATWTPALGQAQQRWERELAALPARFVALAPAELLIHQRRAAAGPAGWLGLGGRRRPRRRRGGVGRRDDIAVAGDRGAAGGAARRALALRGTGAWPRRRVLSDGCRGGGGGRGQGDGDGGDGDEDGTRTGTRTRTGGTGTGWQTVEIASVASDDRPREEPERYAAENLLAGARNGDTRDPDITRGWGVSAVYDGATRMPRQLVLVAARPFGFEGGTRIRVVLRYAAAAQGEVIGRFRLSATDVDQPEAIAALPARLLRVARSAEAARTRDQGERAGAGVPADHAAARGRARAPGGADPRGAGAVGRVDAGDGATDRPRGGGITADPPARARRVLRARRGGHRRRAGGLLAWRRLVGAAPLPPHRRATASPSGDGSPATPTRWRRGWRSTGSGRSTSVEGWSRPARTLARRVRRRRIPSCSTGWRPSCRAAAGGRRRFIA